MKIKDYIKSKEVTIEELKQSFNLIKELDLDIHNRDEDGRCPCWNCGNKYNNHSLRSDSWTATQYCWVCNSINHAFISDRMGGVYTDKVFVFQEK